MYTPGDSIGKTNLMLDLISQRQRALSTNVANIDTPRFVRKDLDFSQYLGTMNNPLETELAVKLGPSGVLQDAQGEVNIANELAEISKNSILYTVATRRMSNIVTQMKTVVNVGK